MGGWKLRISKRSDNFFDLLGGLGVADVTFDSSTTNNKTAVAIDRPAVTLCLGAAFEFGRAQIGIFTGWDLVTDKIARESGWAYQNTPWVSIGIGLQIIGSNTSSKNNKPDLLQKSNTYQHDTKLGIGPKGKIRRETNSDSIPLLSDPNAAVAPVPAPAPAVAPAPVVVASAPAPILNTKTFARTRRTQ